MSCGASSGSSLTRVPWAGSAKGYGLTSPNTLFHAAAARARGLAAAGGSMHFRLVRGGGHACAGRCPAPARREQPER
jgi:hypothetical protein